MERPAPASIPLTPGVYLYKDEKGRVIYVGKARILRRRVLSYFRQDGLPAKTVAMLAKARSIDYLSTNTEKEALLLEASLIRKHKPHYNIILRDDKQYVLFRLDTLAAFPRLEIVRQARRDRARYFGPFTSAAAARETWKLINRAFGLRHCSDRLMKNRVRPCLYHHIQSCPAPCLQLADPAEYQEAVRRVCELLQGRSDELLASLESQMEAAAGELEFERAARLRDQIRAVRRTVERQAAVLPGGGDLDAIGLAAVAGGLALGIVFVRAGAVNDGRTFHWPGLEMEDAPELLASFLAQFYQNQASPPPRIVLPWLPPDSEDEEVAAGDLELASPDALVLTEENGQTADSHPGRHDDLPGKEQAACLGNGQQEPAGQEAGEQQTASQACQNSGTRALLEQIFSERRGAAVRIAIPRNQDEHTLVDMATENARAQALRRKDENANLPARLAKALHLPAAPLRIECVDVSHSSGQQTRVGMVVFADGQPARQDYRIYSMPDSNDDYATLHAWVARRLESGPPWPDLLLIDGGRGQLAAVERGFAEAGESGLIPLAAIAKARDENGQADRRAGNTADRIFIPGRVNALPLRDGCPEILFLQNIRDAAHRFSISRHRRARGKAALSGELMRLPGIGPATARLLWDGFGSLEAIRNAGPEALAALPGIGPAKAARIREKLAKLFS